MIRPAAANDLPEILAVYAHARTLMAENGNPTQWGTTYPAVELLEEDIRLGRLYVDVQDGAICGVFMFVIWEDPTYGYIEDGKWNDPSPYGVIHRVAANGTAPGVLNRCIEFCRGQISHLRIDTHADNYPMQHLLAKLDFSRCGIVYMEDGSPRIAYEWTK